MTKYLCDLKIGDQSIIQGFDISRVADQEFAIDLEDRLLEIGFEEGLDVEVLHKGTFGGDPLAVKIGTITIALRKMEAAAIILGEK